MKKNYFYITLFLLLFSLSTQAQDNKDSSLGSKQDETLNIYPNPVTSDRVFINSKSTLPKEIEVFDVLGKKVLQITISTKELNVSALTPGVYIIKIKEGDTRVTKKLIIK